MIEPVTGILGVKIIGATLFVLVILVLITVIISRVNDDDV